MWPVSKDGCSTLFNFAKNCEHHTMANDPLKPRNPAGALDRDRLDAVVSKARKAAETRQAGYREQSLRLHPWLCARCGREFERSNLSELTVHHIDHNHDNNPPDGSNWENLCLYCHDYEHQKYGEFIKGGGLYEEGPTVEVATHNPFADLKAMLGNK
jgi:predicted Zn-ribbon and HTH transcriptional regulator